MIYIARRLVFSLFIVFGVSVVTFVLTHVLPTDPLAAALGDQAASHPDIVAAYRAKWGLDQPLIVQYGHYIANLVHGNLGTSISTSRAVHTDIGQYLPATTELATAAIVIGVIVSIPLGVAAAVRAGSKIDTVVRFVTVLGASMPIFWLALLLLNVFFLRLGWVPGPTGRLALSDSAPPHATGWYTIDSAVAGEWGTFRDAAEHLLLPAIVLSTWTVGLLTRMTRAAMLRVLSEDYVVTVRSRGASGWYAIWRHALPNASLSIAAVIGLAYADLLAGSVVVERIFGWPGIGAYSFQAATTNDFPAIIGVTLVVAVIYLGVNLCADVYIAARDPRARAT